LKSRILFAVAPFNIDAGAYPYGFALIGTMAKQAGYEVQSLISHPNEDNSGYNLRFLDFISKKDINIVALSSTSMYYPETKLLIELAKSKGCITVLGGFIVSAQPELITANIGADFCVYGEGEYTFLELIDAIENDKDLSAIDGLLYLESGAVVKNRPRKPIKNLDALPFLDLSLFNFDKFSNILMLLGSRSCPYGCTFCYRSPDIPYRQRSLDSLFLELDYFLQRYGNIVKEIQFMDDLFMINKARVLEFCKNIKTYKLPFSIQGRVDCVDEELMAALKDSGCHAMFFGLESVNNNILESMNKKTTFRQIKNALEVSVKHGIMPGGVFIFGDKEDDEYTIQNSIQFFIENISKYCIFLAPIFLLPGTAIYNYAVSQKIITDEIDFLERKLPLTNVSKLAEEQYQFLLGRLESYNKAKEIIALAPIVTRYNSFSINNDGSMNIEFYCPVCGKKAAFFNVGLDALLSSLGQYCRNCGSMFSWAEQPMIKTFNNLNKYREIYAEYLSQYKGRILVYGMNDAIKYFIHAIPEFRKSIVKIVDRNYEYYRNDTFCDLKVESPVSLKDVKYDYFITAETIQAGEIKASLERYGLPADNMIDWENAFSWVAGRSNANTKRISNAILAVHGKRYKKRFFRHHYAFSANFRNCSVLVFRC
jgi:radical SAM superfamily enzyme YgiQ (UPF0313 family)/transcription elongation factor Elf1